VKYKNFLHEVGMSWVSKVQNTIESSSDKLQLLEKQTAPRGPKQVLSGRLSGGFQNTQTGKNCCRWDGNKEISCTAVEICAAHKKQSETRYLCNFCIVPLLKGSCFEKYQSVRNC